MSMDYSKTLTLGITVIMDTKMDYKKRGVLTPLKGELKELFDTEKERVRDSLLTHIQGRRFIVDRGFSPEEMLVVLDRLVPIDGERSNLAVSECGIIRGEVITDALSQYVIKNFPKVNVCTGIGRNDTRYNVYFFRRDGIDAKHILHELFHATYMLDDVELAARLGVIISSGDSMNTREISDYIFRECLKK
jgi:hypothetical protein